MLEKSNALEAVFTFGSAEVGEDINLLADDMPAGRLERGPHRPEDICYLLYTGGTTGVPKAAMLSERAIAQLAYGTSLGWDLPERMRYLAVAPISHAAARGSGSSSSPTRRTKRCPPASPRRP